MARSPRAVAGVRRNPGDPETQTEQAFGLIEEMIVTLELAPGTSVSEATLSSKTGIGRMPIRMALKRLEHMGLVTSLARKGAFIRPISVEDQLAILEVRRPVERMLACKAARLATDAQREALRTNVDAMLRAARAGDLQKYLHFDHVCDRIIYETSRNPFAIEFVTLLYSHSRRYWVSRSKVNDWVRTAELHKEMMNAIADGDEVRTAKASDALIEYLEKSCKASIGVY
jgi:DNA-binding GntR family transcriptional regulator